MAFGQVTRGVLRLLFPGPSRNTEEELMRRGLLVYPLLVLVAFVSMAAAPGGGKSDKRGNFPVREPDTDTPFYPVYEALKAGVEMQEEEAFKAYLKILPADRQATPEAVEELRQKEWANLRSQAGAYLAHDTYGFKITVLEMKPGDVSKDTKKVYLTIRNNIETEDRNGIFIVERCGKNEWKLRSLNL